MADKNRETIKTLDQKIRELKQAEEALSESEEKYSTLVEMSADGILLLKDKKTIFANHSFYKMFGYVESEILGKDILGVTAEDLLDGSTDGEEFRTCQIQLKKKTGEDIWIETNTNPIEYKGEIAEIALLRDITDRKQLEDELKNYTERLEEEVKRQADELIQTEKMSAIGQLVAGVAHEINNPLSYLHTNSKFLKEDISKLKGICLLEDIDLDIFNGIEELLETNIDGVNRIATITKALKRFARPDTEGKAFADINGGIKDTLVMVFNNLKHRVRVHENYGEIPLINCNIGQLNQVFMNIIMNASQAMDKGNIWIKTWCDKKDVYIEIKDNGGGIPEDLMSKLFDPFFTTKDEGTGLGLSISYRIIKDHDGCIIAESFVGKGTTMTIVLPIGGQ